MTLKYLGGIDTPQNIVSGTCVSPPVDYSKVAKHLEDGIVSRVCNFVMTVPCKIALVLNGTMRRGEHLFLFELNVY